MSRIDDESLSLSSGAEVQEWLVRSTADAQAHLFVRARGIGARGGVPVVLVHGFFQPASAILDVPGHSLLTTLAAAGLRVYLFDLRGYGRSSRPGFMALPPEASKPGLGCMADALADLNDVVDFVLTQERASQVDLIGYSWGTARSARYALQSPSRVRRLALYAPVWRPVTGAAGEASDPLAPDQLDPRHGGYAVFRPGDLQRNWDWEIDVEAVDRFRTPTVLQAAEDALMASDPAYPPDGFRAPLGPMVDAMGVAGGCALFEAAALRHEVLLVRGAQDRLSSEADAAALFSAMGSTQKRLITVGWGTHLLHLEHAGCQLTAELAGFLKAPSAKT